MPHETFDRRHLRFEPLANRENKVHADRDLVSPDAPAPTLTDDTRAAIDDLVDKLLAAQKRGAARMLTFGAHTIKNGLGPVLTRLIDQGWLSHLATNGAGIIHDWELAYQGATSEDVRHYLAEGRFGAWEETGRYLNLAIAVGAYEGLGYGESVGKFVSQQRLSVPAPESLRANARECLDTDPAQAAAALDLAALLEYLRMESGDISVPHTAQGLQAAAFDRDIPYTAHPMFGHDIIYEHPANCGAAIGRAAERDFLRFVLSVANLEGGVYVSIGSAVMSPMVFEKALSMARNEAHQNGKRIEDFDIVVVDLAPSTWDWSRGEPPEDNPAYYQRYNKSFARAGGRLRYVALDNRDFLLALCRALAAKAPA